MLGSSAFCKEVIKNIVLWLRHVRPNFNRMIFVETQQINSMKIQYLDEIYSVCLSATNDSNMDSLHILKQEPMQKLLRYLSQRTNCLENLIKGSWILLAKKVLRSHYF